MFIMKNFITSLILLMFLNGIGWELISVVSLKFLKENPEIIVRQFIIEKWIENIKIIQPHCEGAFIEFNENAEDTDLIEVYAKCYKWGV